MASASINPSAILHRRPAYAVNSPAVLCHRCYRLEDVAKSESPILSTIRRNIATVKMNVALFQIQAAGRRPDDRSDILVFRLASCDEPKTQAERDEAIELKRITGAFDSLSAPGAQFLRRLDSQRTILSMLPVVDGQAPGWTGWRARMRVDLHSEFYSVTFILDRLLDKLGGAAPTGQIPGPDCIPTSTKESPGYVNTWYREVWDRFFSALKSAGVTDDFPFTKFNECRGLVLQIPADPAARSAPSAAEQVHDPIVDLYRARELAENRKKRMYEWLNGRLDLMREILQFDRLYRQKDQDANCVLCTVLQGWGIYASSLGQVESGRGLPDRQTTAVDDTAVSFKPDRYLILHDGIARFQLGRLLRRLHVLDELRCAAVFDFGDLISASERIRTLGNEIDRQLHTDDAQREKSGLTREALADIQGELNELTATAVSGGLLYRINRTRYYAQDFKLRMDDMFFERIDGWEPYDIFIHRNLFPILDHIDSIGRRFDTLAARVERLTDARNVQELVKVESEIAYIQSIGEIIGWTAFAYYSSQILSKVILPVCNILPCVSASTCARFEDHEAAMTVSVGVAIAVAAVLFFGFRNRWFGKLFRPG